MKLNKFIVAAILSVSFSVGAGTIAGCKELTPEETSALIKVSTTVLCALEGESLDDPALNKACEEILPHLAPAQRASVEAHLAARKAKAKTLATPQGDAGASQDGGK